MNKQDEEMIEVLRDATEHVFDIGSSTDLLSNIRLPTATSSYIATSLNTLPTHNYMSVNTFIFKKLPTHLLPLPTHMYVLVIIITNTYNVLVKV